MVGLGGAVDDQPIVCGHEEVRAVVWVDADVVGVELEVGSELCVHKVGQLDHCGAHHPRRGMQN